MPAAYSITQYRKRRQDRLKRNFINRAIRLSLVSVIVLSFLIGLIIFGIVMVYSFLTVDLPSPLLLQALLDPKDGIMWQPTRIYDRTGEHLLATLENPATSEKRYLSMIEGPDRLPDTLVKATVAALDPGFWSHLGYSLTWPLPESHPTLAQRLVSDYLLWEEPPSFRRALRERLLAAQITKIYGRDKILEWFLNYANFGEWIAGADAAALTYFGKHASGLTQAEAAVLVGLLETPALNPNDAPLAALDAKDRILDEMYEQGWLTREEFLSAKVEKVAFQSAASPDWEIPPPFLNLMLEQLSDYLPSSRIRQGGLQIVSTVDYTLQSQVECAMKLQLSRLTGDEMNDSNDDLICDAGRLLTSPHESTMEQVKTVETQAVMLDPKTGQVLAYSAAGTSNFDPVYPETRPPGTILTPFVYLTAFSRGMSPATLIWDVPLVNSDDFSLGNPDGQYHGPVRLRTALANDYLIPASKILVEMGVDPVVKTAHLMGLVSFNPLPDTKPSEFFEENEVSLLELIRAFGVLAHQGIAVGLERINQTSPERTPLIQPLTILSVADLTGSVILDCTTVVSSCKLSSQVVISPQLAYLLTDVLSDENARWPSLGHPNPLEIGRPAAAKIGRTSSGNDTWALGYTPDLVVGVWLGSPIGKENLSPLWAAGLWHALTQFANRNDPVQSWSVPPGISRVSVCDPSGLLPTKECPTIVTEVFLAGTEPTHYDTLFRAVQINRETGRLATIFTPVEQIEERIYMVVPPEAQEWAQRAGLPAIPEAYDLYSRVTEESGSARIDSPQNFTTVGGKVSIMGQASGPGFKYYRIQVGQGIYPQSWLQIGVDQVQPVNNGLLAVWDTEGFNGLYALQLLVVGENDRVDVATIQVTVDNNPPEIEIRFPASGQSFQYPAMRTLTFQVEANDDLQLASVEYYLNGSLIANRRAPPYAQPWDVTLGNHELTARAIDLAGNISEDQIYFTVQR